MLKTSEQVKNLIYGLLAPAMEQRGISEEEVRSDQNLIEVGVLDSLSYLELLTNLESETGVEIDFDNMDPSNFTTIDSLIAYFHKPE